jgi:hypothetical protein
MDRFVGVQAGLRTNRKIAQGLWLWRQIFLCGAKAFR